MNQGHANEKRYRGPPPFPYLELATNDKTAAALKGILLVFSEMEKTRYGDVTRPDDMTADMGVNLSNAILDHYNHEDTRGYIARVGKVLSTLPRDEALAEIRKLLVYHWCHTHMCRSFVEHGKKNSDMANKDFFVRLERAVYEKIRAELLAWSDVTDRIASILAVLRVQKLRIRAVAKVGRANASDGVNAVDVPMLAPMVVTEDGDDEDESLAELQKRKSAEVAGEGVCGRPKRARQDSERLLESREKR